MLLTKIGRCQEAIHAAMSVPGISAAEQGMLITLLDFVSTQNDREYMNAFVSDLDLQKSLSLKGYEDYKKQVLDPMLFVLSNYTKLIESK